MPNFNGQLRSNEIFAALYNMIISQQVFADNIKDTKSTLVDMARVDGSLYGDTKLYYATDVLKSTEWSNDAEAQNLLALHRPESPDVQAIIIDKFRQISLTVDDYMSKRAWGTEGAFSQFNSVMLGWLRDTKRVYDSTLYNSYIGTAETSVGNQAVMIELPTSEDAEAQARLQAGAIAETMANLLVELEDVSRDYNDYSNLRSFDSSDLIAVWNSEALNKIKKIDLPTIFHKDGLIDKMGEHTLPARYFGTVNTSGASAPADNTTIRSLIETDYAVASQADDRRAKKVNNQWIVHVFPGDLLPNGSVYLANETYTQDERILFKLYHKDSVPYMSAFEVGTSFFNPKSLTENRYLTFGHNTLEYLKNYPFITVRAE